MDITAGNGGPPVFVFLITMLLVLVLVFALYIYLFPRSIDFFKDLSNGHPNKKQNQFSRV